MHAAQLRRRVRFSVQSAGSAPREADLVGSVPKTSGERSRVALPPTSSSPPQLRRRCSATNSRSRGHCVRPAESPGRPPCSDRWLAVPDVNHACEGVRGEVCLSLQRLLLLWRGCCAAVATTATRCVAWQALRWNYRLTLCMLTYFKNCILQDTKKGALFKC